MTNTQLQEELDRLLAENARLRDSQQDQIDRLSEQNAQLQSEIVEVRAQAATQPVDPLVPTAQPPLESAHRPRSRWWTVLSVFLIVIGLVLAPAAVVASWAKNQLSNTDTFVATFAPLADDPAVQAYVADEVVAAIEQKIDIDGLTNQVFDGVEGLGLPDRAASALDLLRAPAAAGIKNLISDSVNKFVASDAFATIWTQTLTVSHQQLIATLEGDKNAAVTIGPNGEIGIQLGPIIDQVKDVLVKQGIGLAAQIPSIDKTIVVAQSDNAVTLQTAYQVAVAAGIWLPWVALLFLVAGVVVARRRMVALLGASISLAVVMILLGSGLSVGRIIFVASLSPTVMPSDTAGAIYEQVVRFIGDTTLAVAVLAITVAVIGWLASGFRPAVALRRLFASWVVSLRGAAERHRVTTGRFGEWLYRWRIAVRIVIGLGAAAIVLFTRPLTPGLIIWTAVIALVLLGINELLQRPVIEVPETVEPDTPVTVG